MLPSEVINQIAAGEVVERPAHMVKELIENALDAGASEITIDFWNGGQDLILTDNGSGMSKEDLCLSVDRNATSKIQIANDLWSLSSYGFRGEALASISSVSDFAIKSRLKDSARGHVLSVRFGNKGIVEDCDMPVGTQISISGLFENVPARKKFLKSANNEVLQIKTVLKAAALANPNVTFRILKEHTLELYWGQSENCLQRAMDVLDQTALYELRATLGALSAQVVVASPTVTQKTSKNIWIFVNGRFVQDRGLQAAVTEGYRTTLMHGEYPIAVVFLTCPGADVDVNVSPTKSSVRFSDSSLAFRVVHHAVRSVVTQKSEYQIPEPAPLDSAVDPVQSWDPKNWVRKVEKQDVMLVQDSNGDSSLGSEGLAFSRQVPEAEPPIVRANQSSLFSDFVVGTKKQKTFCYSQLEPLAQIKETYIVCETQNEMILVDQHAAHERVMFEKLRAGWDGEKLEIQSYLVPLTLEIREEWLDVVVANKSEFLRFGIEVEQIGPSTLAVNSAPSALKEKAIEAAIHRFCDEVERRGGSFAFEHVVDHLVATLACHSAIRAGQRLSNAEMRSLLVQMDEYPLSGFCPHGRPVHIELNYDFIEKEFGRKV